MESSTSDNTSTHDTSTHDLSLSKSSLSIAADSRDDELSVSSIHDSHSDKAFGIDLDVNCNMDQWKNDPKDFITFCKSSIWNDKPAFIEGLKKTFSHHLSSNMEKHCQGALKACLLDDDALAKKEFRYLSRVPPSQVTKRKLAQSLFKDAVKKRDEIIVEYTKKSYDLYWKHFQCFELLYSIGAVSIPKNEKLSESLDDRKKRLWSDILSACSYTFKEEVKANSDCLSRSFSMLMEKYPCLK